MRDCNLGAVAGAFLTGALIGGALALLYAPRSGAETRERIRDFVDDEVDMVRDKAARARDWVENEIEGYKRKARRAANRAAHRVEDFIDDARERFDDARDRFEDAEGKIANEISAAGKAAARKAGKVARSLQNA